MRSLILTFALVLSFQAQAAERVILSCEDQVGSIKATIKVDPSTLVAKGKATEADKKSNNVIEAVGQAIGTGIVSAFSELALLEGKGTAEVIRVGKSELEGKETHVVDIKIINFNRIRVDSAMISIDLEEVGQTGKFKGQAAVGYGEHGDAAMVDCKAVR